MYETIKAGENIIYICIFIYVWENISYMHNNNIGRYSSYLRQFVAGYGFVKPGISTTDVVIGLFYRRK